MHQEPRLAAPGHGDQDIERPALRHDVDGVERWDTHVDALLALQAVNKNMGVVQAEAGVELDTAGGNSSLSIRSTSMSTSSLSPWSCTYWAIPRTPPVMAVTRI